MGDKVDSKLYQLFGVAEYAERLRKETKNEELEKLDETLSKFILVKGIEDLSEEDLDEMDKAEIKNGQDIYNFFNKHIEDFPSKLNQYGREFRRTYTNN